MADDVLSQNEIDALLSALSTGEMDAEELKIEENKKRVKTYDFKRALRFSKDQIRSLTRLHENYARLLTTLFSAKLRTVVQLNVASVDQIPYEEFIRSVPKMTLLNVIEVPPLEGRVIMEVNPNVAYAMLDRLLGGKGEGINKIENLTEIETKLLQNIFYYTLESMQEAWSSLTQIDPILADFEVNTQFLQMIAPNETVVVISLNTQIGEATGMINICIPHVTLEPILPKLSVHYWMQSTKKAPNENEIKQLKKRIHVAEVPVIAELGTTNISIQDFLALDIGDVIRLDQEINEPLIVKVGELPKFLAQPGKSKKKLAVQILDEFKRGEQDDEW
ncbi:flagellar motor switch protein FliM [Metabacillus iocasae]|uniref:Flagellar motor switch protein FliM n=1 Tax=Priestia iocasae TaxID=2291674 RepID=A0ABS2QR03_9BACI|nr:flagellar motor switch protein FliM [Metabacillus iocasae]MBM7701874.1 flagellar motor switch protein FliM [Metabacillus iocasae]